MASSELWVAQLTLVPVAEEPVKDLVAEEGERWGFDHQ